jgi:hypothetical protein
VRLPLAIIAGALACLFIACGGGDDRTSDSAELNDDPSLPGEYVDIPGLYGGGYPADAQHVTEEVDFTAQGLPPVGGPHWGSNPCPTDPAQAPPFCGPVQWGVYREPWPAASLIHNMEHGGVVVWYNTADQALIRRLEQMSADLLRQDRLVVLVPYPDLQPEHLAITAWTRRDLFRASEFTEERLLDFVEAHDKRANPEQF